MTQQTEKKLEGQGILSRVREGLTDLIDHVTAKQAETITRCIDWLETAKRVAVWGGTPFIEAPAFTLPRSCGLTVLTKNGLVTFVPSFENEITIKHAIEDGDQNEAGIRVFVL